MTASDPGAPITTKAGHSSSLSSATCPPIFQLADFGDVTTLEKAQDAFAAATKAALSCQPNPGGVIQISPQTTPEFTVRTSTPLISVIDDRNGVHLIQASEEGNKSADVLSGSAGYPRATTLLRRTRTDPETSYPRGNDAAQSILQRTIHGASSIRTTLLFSVRENTANAKWYPRGITGFFVGQRFVATASGNTQYTVTGLGWDPNPPHSPSTLGPSGPLPYFVADTHDTAIPAGDLVTNKSFLNSLSLVNESHCGNQCAGALAIRHSSYSQGDTFGVSQQTVYMGDVISAGGDEGGVCFSASIINDLANFRATVSDFAVDSTLPPPTTGLAQTPTGEGTLTYEGGSNTERLGTCRPIINLNPDKWISTAKGDGQIRIWRPTQRRKNDFEEY
ncbi:MAG: hypothetical protein ACREP9_22500 [Candidatus Dormibacteraceae bacterium]